MPSPRQMVSDKREITKAPDAEVAMLRAVEYLFYAHRAFVIDGDTILAEFRFGRAHHRALFLIARWPGITVNRLLARLKITNQSLGRVLSDLLKNGFVMQTTDTEDRRQRRQYLTAKGAELDRRLCAKQFERISRASEKIGSEGMTMLWTALHGMMDEDDREALRFALPASECASDRD